MVDAQAGSDTRCGFVALIGAPNAGKSTLLNALVGSKVTIVSRKVQTTRALIRGIAVEGESQLIFVDTPGIFAPRRRLDRAMVTTAWSGAHDADLVGVLIDARKGIDEEAEAILERLADVKVPKILILNKIDVVPRDTLLALTKVANDKATFEATFMISALTGDGVADLKQWLAARMPAGPVALSARSDVGRADAPAGGRNHAREAVRAAAPGTALPLDGRDRNLEGIARAATCASSRRSMWSARASARSCSARAAQTIKAIGEAARKEIAEIVEAKVHLFLFVKVREGWGEDPGALPRHGAGVSRRSDVEPTSCNGPMKAS